MVQQKLEVMNKILYPSHFEIFRKLKPEQVYQLINKIGDSTFELTDSMCIGIWMSMERDFQVQEENYRKTVERNRENGKKGGRPLKTQDNPNKPTITQETQVVLEKPTETQPNPENLKDKDKDKEIDIDKEIDKVFFTDNTGQNFKESITKNDFFEMVGELIRMGISQDEATNLIKCDYEIVN